MKLRGHMNIILFYLAVLGCTVAVPNGYYHQEYNYKTSSSSFKNNELQRKTDDQGYYRKDGDLDGRVKPVVDANSEHSEYVNPNSQGGQYYGGANTDFSSTGNMRAQNGYTGYASNALEAEGLARSDRIVGSTSGHSTGYSSGYGSNALGSHSQSYGTSNLRVITSRLQQELENDLQEAVRQNNIYPQTRVDIAQLERELKQNLTERLNNELTAKFGQQMVRGGMSYTITGGRLQSTANYDNEELGNLRSQLENTLMNQLRTQYSSSSSSSSSNSQYYNRQGSYGYTTTVRPVYHSVYPSLPSYTSTVRYPVDYNHANYPTTARYVVDYNQANYPTTARYPVDYNQGNYQTVRYTPVTNPQSITNIATRVQNRLDTRLNEVLDETRRKYFSSDAAYSLTNTDVLLERIRNELRSNLTYLLDEDIRSNYGTQIQRDGYLYSVGPTGQTSTDYNYSMRDLEQLKKQVENNLIEKLNKDFESHRSSWSSHQSYNSQSSYGSNYQYSSTPRYYEVITTPRQSYVNQYPNSASHQGGYIKTGSSASSNQYDYATGSQHSGYGVQSSGSIAQLQSKLQDDLSRQLRGALSTGHYSSSSSSGGYSPQNYQSTLQQLSDDLNRNLTRHLQEYSAMGSYAAYGNFDSAQMQRLKTQLQESLMSQLQQGLQQSYQASSSYSSSSSSNSNYRPVRGFQNYQAAQYRSGLETVAGEDCAGDDPNAYSRVRAKRSYRYPSGNRLVQPQHPTELGQELDDYDSTQQIEDSGFGKNSNYEQGQQVDDTDDYGKLLGQQVDESDLTQQVEDSPYGKLQISGQGQHIYDSDLTQQVEDSSYGKLQISNQGQQVDDSESIPRDSGKLQVSSQGQYVDDADLTQQVEDSGYGKLQISNQGQEVDNSYLTQQVEDSDHRKLQFSNQGQQVDDSDTIPQIQDSGKLQVSNQVEDSGYEKLQIPNQGQQVDNSYPTQQVEDSDYGKLQISNQGQQVEDSETIPQVQDSGKLQVSNQGQYIDDADLTQQVEDSGYGKLQIPTQGQHVDNPYLTQQVEDSDNRKLQFSNQGQQVDDSDSFPQVQDSGKLQVSNQGQYVDEAGLTQQVEDTGFGELQILNQGQEVDNSYSNQHQQEQNSGVGRHDLQSPVDAFGSIQQVEQRPQYSNQLGDETGDSNIKPNHVHFGQNLHKHTQLVEQSAYEKLEIPRHDQKYDAVQHELFVKPEMQPDGQYYVPQQGKSFESASNQDEQHPEPMAPQSPQHPVANHELGQVDNTHFPQQVDNSGFDDLNAQHHIETGQQVDDSELTQQVVDHPGVGEYNPQYPTELKPQIEDSNNRIVGQVPQLAVNPEIPDRPIESEQGLRHPTEKPVAIEQGRVVPQNEDIPSNQLGVTSENDYEKIERWCSKYVDTSIMDASWTLSSQLEGDIDREYHLLADGTIDAQKDILYQRILANLPKNIIYTCFHVADMIQSKQDEVIVVEGLEDYLKSLIKQKVDTVVRDAKNNNQQPEKLEVTSENEYEKIDRWCSKYVDTSIMDASWTLGSQLEEDIDREYHLLADDTMEAQKDKLYQRILAKLPKNIMYTCFKVDNMKQTEQEKDEIVMRLEGYFKSLIKQKVDKVVRDNKNDNQQPEKVETDTTGNENTWNQELEDHWRQEIKSSLTVIEDWCAKYIDKSLMDTPWKLGFQLKSTIAKQCSRTIRDGSSSSEWQFIYGSVVNEIPTNITDCFDLHGIGLNEVQLAGKRHDIETYMKSLIKDEVVTSCKLEDKSLSSNQDIPRPVESDDNLQQIEYNPLPLGPLLPRPTSQKSTTNENQYPQTPSTDEIGRPPKVNDLPTLNQVIVSNPNRGENLPQPQIINGVTDEVNVLQSITPISIQSKPSEAAAFGITDQGQFVHRPQTLPEAEHTADSLVDALRKSQTNRQNQQTTTDNYPRYSYYGRHSFGSYGQRSHVYENTRQFGRPHGQEYSPYPKYNRPGYDNKPIGYNHGPYPGSYGSNPYHSRNSYGYSHQPPRYNKPLHHGQVDEVVPIAERSDIEPIRTGEVNSVHPVSSYGYSHQPPRYNKPLHHGQVEEVVPIVDTTSDIEPIRTGEVNSVHPVNSYGYSHQPPRYNKPLYHGQVEEVAPIAETTSDIEPVRTGQANFVNHVKPVYSGVKGRSRPSGSIYQPAVPYPRPTPVQEPVAVQEIVKQDVTSPQVVDEATPLSTGNEKLPWWKRFGNKVKQGAADLKNKVIGR